MINDKKHGESPTQGEPIHSPAIPQQSPQTPYTPYPYIAATSLASYPQPYQAPLSFQHQTPIVPSQTTQSWTQNLNANQRKTQNDQDKKPIQHDPIPMSYTELLPHLLHNGLVALCPVKPMEPPYPKWYDPNAQ